MDHGWSAGAVGMAGIGAAIYAGPVDFAGTAPDELCAGVQRNIVGPHHANAHNHGSVAVAYGSSGHFSGWLALGGGGNRTGNYGENPSGKQHVAVPQGGTEGNSFPEFILGWTTGVK